MAIRPPHYPSITELQRSEPFALHLARGLVAGHTSINLGGFQSDVNSTFIPIWEYPAEYVYPTYQQHLLYSDSALDTNVLIRVRGLDNDYNEITENLLLTNGTVGVTTVLSYLRISNIFVLGSVNPVGQIVLGNAAKTQFYAAMRPGAGTSEMTIYTVPAGHTFYLAKSRAYATQSTNQKTNYRVQAVNEFGIMRTVLEVPFTESYLSEKTVPRAYPEKTDAQWQCSSSLRSTVGLQVEGVLIKNTIS